MKKILITLSTFLFFSINTSGFTSQENVKKLSSMYKSGGTTQSIVIPQNTKFAINIKKIIFCQKLKYKYSIPKEKLASI